MHETNKEVERMRSSLMVRASDCQCTSCNGPGFDPSIRRHSGIWRAADEAVLNIVRKKKKKSPQKIKKLKFRHQLFIFANLTLFKSETYAKIFEEEEWTRITKKISRIYMQQNNEHANLKEC